MIDPNPRAAPSSQRVLLVEDHEHIRKLINASLKPLGIPIDEATSGDVARRLLNANPDAYTLAILDIMLPGGTNGLHLCHEIIARRNAAGHGWPFVIVLSAHAQQSDRQMATVSGADRFMAKPFSPLELLATVKAHRSPSQTLG
jgi:DNA-binding response OmpR family regulator